MSRHKLGKAENSNRESLNHIVSKIIFITALFKYVGVQVSNAYPPKSWQKCATTTPHKGGVERMGNQGIS